jgi:ferredoxin-thioredoxin reductase catalytic chain
MMKQIDMSSDEFITELAKTKKFTDKVNKQFGWEYHPNHDVTEGVTMGLARHKLLYNKRFCPCFMVMEDENGKPQSADNRICPCKPAIEKEIPEEGKCHCGIFCSPEYAAQEAAAMAEATKK